MIKAKFFAFYRGFHMLEVNNYEYYVGSLFKINNSIDTVSHLPILYVWNGIFQRVTVIRLGRCLEDDVMTTQTMLMDL
jgi:hypothetical protein